VACGDIDWWRGGAPDFVGLLERHGQAEHLVVQFDFLVQPTRLARAEFSIPGASKTRNGATGYADIVSVATQDIWEVKPYNLEGKAVEEAAWYATNAKIACGPQWKPGQTYTTKDNNGIVFVVEGGGNRAELHAWQGPPGAVLYQWEINGKKVELPNAFYGRAIREDIIKKYFYAPIQRLPNARPEPNDLPPIKWKPPVYARGLFDQLALPGADRLAALIIKAVRSMYQQVPEGGAIAVALEPEIVDFIIGAAKAAQTVSRLQVKTDPTVDLYRKALLAVTGVGAGGQGLVGLAIGIGAVFYVGAGLVVEFVAATAALAVVSPSAAVASLAASLRAARVALAVGAGLFAFIVPRASRADQTELVSMRASLAMFKVLTPDEARRARLGDKANVEGREGIIIALMGAPPD
jgi:hypothetical protein